MTDPDDFTAYSRLADEFIAKATEVVSAAGSTGRNYRVDSRRSRQCVTHANGLCYKRDSRIETTPMARTRKLPADKYWLRDYLRKQGLKLAPEAAAQQLDAEQWRRLQAAWRAHRAKGRQAARPKLKPESWSRLELIARRLGAADLDSAIAKLDEVHDLGGLVRETMSRQRGR